MRFARSGMWLAVSMAAVLLVADSAPAMAQFRGPTNFLDRLFGRDREVAPPADTEPSMSVPFMPASPFSRL